MAARSGRALAAAVRVVDGVHRGTACLRADAHVTLAPGLADLDILMIGVADRADRRAALGADHPHFARRQPQRDVIALLRQQLHADPRRPRQLATAAGRQLDVVDNGAGWHVAERQAVADTDVDVG